MPHATVIAPPLLNRHDVCPCAEGHRCACPGTAAGACPCFAHLALFEVQCECGAAEYAATLLEAQLVADAHTSVAGVTS